MRGHERLWSKVYDGCTHHHANFFVVTTYREWVFGAFSKGRSFDSSVGSHWLTPLLVEHSQAWTSDIMPYDSRDPDPTIVEHLVYWLASATVSEASLVKPFVIPKVSSEEEHGTLLHPSTLRSICLGKDGRVDRTALEWLVRYP